MIKSVYPVISALGCCIFLSFTASFIPGTVSHARFNTVTGALSAVDSKKVSIGFCNCPGTECRYGYSADCSAGKSTCIENPCGPTPSPCGCE